MKYFKRTDAVVTGDFVPSTPEEAEELSHYHIIYCNMADTPTARMSQAEDGHTHEIEWYTEPITEPNQPPKPGYFRILPDPRDGHTHEIVDYVREVKSKKQTENEVVDEVHSLFKTACEVEADSAKVAEECDDFYMGKQWDEQTRHKLESQDRAALTINLTEKLVDELLGYQQQMRRDLRLVAKGEGDQRTADFYNILLKHALVQGKYLQAEARVFEDQVVPGRGNFSIYVDFEKDVRGVPQVRRLPWKDVKYGPHEEYDAEDCEYLVKSKLFSLLKLKELWPDKAEKIADQISLFDGSTTTSNEHVQYNTDQYAQSDAWLPTTFGGHVVLDIAKKEIRVFECQRIRYVPTVIAGNTEEDFYDNLYGWKPDDIAAIKTIPGFFVAKRNVRKIRVTRVAGHVLLSDENPADLPVDRFTVIPVYAKKRGNHYWGKVKRALDPQREINKRHSQTIDIGNKCAVYGHFYDANTFPDEQSKSKWLRQSAQPGFNQEVSDINRTPKQAEGVKFPTELVEMLELSRKLLGELLTIAPDRQSANESASSLMHRQKQQLIGSEYLFTNLSDAKKAVGEIFIAYIQRYYTPERAIEILYNEDAKTPQEIQGKALREFSKEQIKDLLSKFDVSKYDLEVAEIASSPTVRLQTFMLLSELGQRGLPIPPDLLLEVADIPDSTKKRIQQTLAQQAQAQAEAETSKADAEVDKTLAAKGVYTPAVKKRIQGADQNGAGQPQEPKPQPQGGF